MYKDHELLQPIRDWIVAQTAQLEHDGLRMLQSRTIPNLSYIVTQADYPGPTYGYYEDLPHVG